MKRKLLQRSVFIGTAVSLVLAAPAIAQSPESSWSTSLITLLAPILLLIVIWFLIWKRISFGKGGYRKLIAENQERMWQIETHLAEISRQLERIATSLERSGR